MAQHRWEAWGLEKEQAELQARITLKMQAMQWAAPARAVAQHRWEAADLEKEQAEQRARTILTMQAMQRASPAR